MRWNKKLKPMEGDIRCIRKFLFFPLEINGEVRWLELATYKEKFYMNRTKWGWDYEKWVNS